MPYVGQQHNHAKSALHGARAAWVVGQYSAGPKVREPRVTGFKSDGHERSYHVPPTCRGVGAVEPQPTA